MKSLAITFFTAIAIVGIALICDVASGKVSTEENGLVGKTTITRDSRGRIISELTVAINGKEWQETSMRQLSYYDNKNEAVTYKKVDGSWMATSKVVTETSNGVPVSLSYFVSSPSGRWVEVAEQKADDLSSNDVVDDVVFDADGNLVMKATYVYKDGERLGIQKEEYGYEDNTQKTRVFYAWNGDRWSKTVSAKVVSEE